MRDASLRDDYVVIKYVLLKLASRCNLDCKYCYWFRDDGVYAKPRLLLESAETALCERIREQANKYKLEEFSILFHGGEPLLFGKERFENLNIRLNQIEEETGCRVSRMITTNAVLIDAEWANLFLRYSVLPTVSIDGPAHVHDQNRVDLSGQPTHEKVLRGLEHLRLAGVNFSALAVADPKSDPEIVADFLAFSIGLKQFDIMVPDNNHDDSPASISYYYRRLFDLWIDKYAPKGVTIRYPKEMLRGVLGGHSNTESIGYGPVTSVTINTDGALEPLDVLRIGSSAKMATSLNILSHDLQSIIKDSVWSSALRASVNVSRVCLGCQYLQCCGGGYLPHRYSEKSGYDNPSVYCEDLKDIFAHIRERCGDLW